MPAWAQAKTTELRQQAQTADAGVQALLAGVVPEIQRRQGHRALRRQAVIDFATGWRRICRGLPLVLDGTCQDWRGPVRLGVTYLGATACNGHPDLSVIEAATVIPTNKPCWTVVVPIARLSLHTVGRWFEANPDAPEFAVLDDLVPLGKPVQADLMQPGATGCWFGGTVTVSCPDPRPLWSAEMFLPSQAFTQAARS